MAHGSSEAAFTLVDLSAEPDPERAARARIARTLATPLPLGDRSLFALELLALAPREWRAVIRCHHLLADEAGLSMILHHWLSAYRALTSDGPAELAPPSSYVAEIAADVAYAESERYRADLDYWTGRFKSLSPQLLQPQGASATATGVDRAWQGSAVDPDAQGYETPAPIGHRIFVFARHRLRTLRGS